MSDNQLPQLTPKNLKEAVEFCDRICKTAFVPDAYKNKPMEALACIQMGAEVGLGPMQSLQNISVINGRPSLWGDVMLALVQQSGLIEWIKETATADSATCEVKRKNDKEPCTITWSHADTIKAGLQNKDNHVKYPKRMRQMRARGFALRDKFPDVLRGLISREEAMDIPTTAKPVADGLDTGGKVAEKAPMGELRKGTPSGVQAETVVQVGDAIVVVPDVVDGAVRQEEASSAGSESASKEVGPSPLSDASAAPRSGGEDRVLNQGEIDHVNQMLDDLGLDFGDLGLALHECSDGKIKTLKKWPESKYQDLTERLRQMATSNA